MKTMLLGIGMILYSGLAKNTTPFGLEWLSILVDFAGALFGLAGMVLVIVGWGAKESS